MWPSTRCALVADSQELFSNAVKDLLERRLGFTEVIVVTSFESATWHLSGNSSISLALVDLTLPDMDGLASLASLRVAYPDLRLAVVAGPSRREEILRALSVGVHGFVPRTLSINEMVQALSGIVNGQIYVPPTLSDVLDETFPNTVANLEATLNRNMDGPDRRAVALTSRQQEVMQLISEGKTNKEIARSLGLAEGTVKAHVNALFRALSVHNRASVAAMQAQQQDGNEE
jgi:DNA-binding NarL/FixJ family response regulator